MLGNVEALLEVHAFLHQQTNQLGDGHGGVGVVELHGVEVCKMGQVIAMGHLVGAHHILQGSGGEHILLLDAQALALPGGVVGIQHTGDVLGLVLLLQSPQVVLVVEGIEVQRGLRLALPQAQGVDVVGAVADHGHIIGDGQHGLVRELHPDGVVVAAVGPGITKLGPVISGFLLAAVFIKALLEQAVLIPQAIAGQGNVGGSGGVQEAGSQTAQAAVAQCIVLDFFQNSQINAVGGK